MKVYMVLKSLDDDEDTGSKVICHLSPLGNGKHITVDKEIAKDVLNDLQEVYPQFKYSICEQEI